MRVNLQCLALAVSLFAFVHSVDAADCSTLSGCAAKVCEVENLMEQARKEGNMRRLSTLSDIRTEAKRCSNEDKKKEEPVQK